MIGKGPGWSHSLRLIKFFSDLTNFLKINSADLAQQQNYMKLQSSVFYCGIVTFGISFTNSIIDKPGQAWVDL
jgi:hypothetical protein